MLDNQCFFASFKSPSLQKQASYHPVPMHFSVLSLLNPQLKHPFDPDYPSGIGKDTRKPDLVTWCPVFPPKKNKHYRSQLRRRNPHCSRE